MHRMISYPILRLRDHEWMKVIEEAGLYLVELCGSQIPVYPIRLTFRYSPRHPDNHPYRVFLEMQLCKFV